MPSHASGLPSAVLAALAQLLAGVAMGELGVASLSATSALALLGEAAVSLPCLSNVRFRLLFLTA